ncbi:hypothetical protein SCHPADRAFT_334978 [Schizopora paradoxa]|uniref:Uncharacterized protein n=1 Tax=Schizopora paradoxa TaxID=27342 RepID=A0A0H2SAX2_9AGAM|nr:hypothetical protein SCHPADRAFT_334978 [Schizopora paradoxa]
MLHASDFATNRPEHRFSMFTMTAIATYLKTYRTDLQDHTGVEQIRPYFFSRRIRSGAWRSGIPYGSPNPPHQCTICAQMCWNKNRETSPGVKKTRDAAKLFSDEQLQSVIEFKAVAAIERKGIMGDFYIHQVFGSADRPSLVIVDSECQTDYFYVVPKKLGSSGHNWLYIFKHPD